MRTTITQVMLAIVVCAFCVQADGARFFLSTNDVGRDDFLAEIGPGFTGRMYILAQLEPGESIPAMGISLHADDAANFAVSNVRFLNPVGLLTAQPRWNQTSFTEGSGNTLIGELFGVQVGGGLSHRRFVLADMLNDPTYNRQFDVVQVATFNLDIVGYTGTLWLSGGPSGLPVQPTAQNQGDLVGFGDDDAPNNLAAPSGNPDLYPYLPPIPGDMTGNGRFDAFDTAPFELALARRDLYELAFPGLSPLDRGDINNDYEFNAFDVAPFEALLAAKGAAVPEPGTVSLFVLAGVMGMRRGRRC